MKGSRERFHSPEKDEVLHMRTRKTVLGAIALTAAVGMSASGAAALSVHAQHTHAKVKKIKTTEVDDKYVFAPKKVTITRGTKVTWVNTSDAPHTVTFKTGGTYDKMLAQSASLSHTFNKAGTYKYFCKYHAGMVATIVVK
jgi:plastocyanin